MNLGLEFVCSGQTQDIVTHPDELEKVFRLLSLSQAEGHQAPPRLPRLLERFYLIDKACFI